MSRAVLKHFKGRSIKVVCREDDEADWSDATAVKLEFELLLYYKERAQESSRYTYLTSKIVVTHYS